MERAKTQIISRMYMVLTLLGILPLFVVGQMLRIYLYDAADLRVQGARQASWMEDIPATRGAIMDREGRMLAVNTVRYRVALDPTVDGFKKKAGAFYQKLGALTRHPASFYSRKVANRSSKQYVLLAYSVTEPQKESIEAWNIPGILLRPLFARRYNYGTTAAHLLGHVNSDGHGLAGLEKQYDEILQGTPGRRAVKRDRRGARKAFVGGLFEAPRHGENLVLTVDLIRQSILEEELARGVAESGAKWGTGIAMDPRTGAVLAMANVPVYDPNRVSAFPVAARRNHAVTDRIEPGSTFKLVTAVAATEQDIVHMSDSVDTGNGWRVFHGRTMRDTHAHGTITFTDVIALSSNVGVAQTADKLDKGIFYQYARNLGFGQPTWIDLPGEVSGQLKKPAQWSGTTQTSMSIGYEVEVTPMQILTAYCALANGGLLVQPFVVAERRDVQGNVVWRARQDSVRRAFKKETARKLLPAFEAVVSRGTAREARVDSLLIAGKTGTALKVINGRYSRTASRASFVGFFPADNPVVALLVVMDEPKNSLYGGVVSGPVFQRVAQRWMGTFPETIRHMAVADPKNSSVPVPDVADVPVAVATNKLLAAGFSVDAPEIMYAHVAAQQPQAGEKDRIGNRVKLDLEALEQEASVMPNLTGLSTRQAAFWLMSQGVKVTMKGSGTVVRQTPRAGQPLDGNAVLQGK